MIYFSGKGQIKQKYDSKSRVKLQLVQKVKAHCLYVDYLKYFQQKSPNSKIIYSFFFFLSNVTIIVIHSEF